MSCVCFELSAAYRRIIHGSLITLAQGHKWSHTNNNMPLGCVPSHPDLDTPSPIECCSLGLDYGRGLTHTHSRASHGVSVRGLWQLGFLCSQDLVKVDNVAFHQLATCKALSIQESHCPARCQDTITEDRLTLPITSLPQEAETPQHPKTPVLTNRWVLITKVITKVTPISFPAFGSSCTSAP